MMARYDNDSPLGATVHRNVDAIRYQRGLFIWQLCDAMGIAHKVDYYRIFWRTPTQADLELLATALGVTVDELLRSK